MIYCIETIESKVRILKMIDCIETIESKVRIYIVDDRLYRDCRVHSVYIDEVLDCVETVEFELYFLIKVL